MTANFGKLENQTLQLEPGLNVIHAPNEWGKSTWCAFLVAMLYGIDTSERTKKASIADKERYAPWSGAPMSGRMEISWQGRDITIQRRSKGRIPMGEFSAIETDTGLPVAELTAANCGQVLLGVERSVFQRAGFIALSDLPVTRDESLRRRLNALVTTGDESGAADDLAQKLKDKKNKVRFNRTGLLPEAEEEQRTLEKTLAELHGLQEQCQSIRTRQAELEGFAHRLENHRQALAYAAAQEDRLRLEQAQADCRLAAGHLATKEALCQTLPDRETAGQKLEALRALAQEQTALQEAAQALPELPRKPQAPVRYACTDPANAVQEAQQDLDYVKNQEQVKRGNSRAAWIYCALAAAALLLLLIPAVQPYMLYLCLAVALGGLALLAVCIQRTNKMRWNIQRVYDRHPGLGVDKWLTEAQTYAHSCDAYEKALEAAQAVHTDWNRRKDALSSRLAQETEGQPLSQAMAYYTKVLEHWDALAEARREHEWSEKCAIQLQQSLKAVEPAAQPDELNYTAELTQRLAQDTDFELKQLHIRLGQCQGKMEQLGQEKALQRKLDGIRCRIDRLNRTYGALELAQQFLAAATAQLQRRFAPQITRQAQDIFSRLTDGKYNRLSLSEDLAVSAGADTETTLRSAQWRSEGTVDQLYLSLRLAVARELTPQAPLVLDDAFARFDDTRLQRAMEVLRQEAESRQVILFSCQSREATLQ